MCRLSPSESPFVQKVAHACAAPYTATVRIPRPGRRVGWLLVAIAAGLPVAWAVGSAVERRERATLTAATVGDARLRQALLASEVARFRLLPLALADDRDVIAALTGSFAARRTLDRKLEALRRDTGAAVIYFVGRKGLAIAASNWREPRSFVGNDYRFRRYYRDALRTGAGEQFALGTVSHRPGLYLSRRSASGGVVVVKLEFDAIERQWRAAGGTTYVTDRRGVVLVSSRPDWRFAATRPIAPAAAAAERADLFVMALLPAPVPPPQTIAVTTEPNATGWRVTLIQSTRPIAGVVRTAQVAALLGTLILAAIGWTLRERGRRRTERTLALESAVAARTADLSREIEERAAAEARADDLREGLRQANRLAALGQITASVAHETAQPVAAIRNYAASGELLLDRGDVEAVRGNLHAIGRLTERIGSVTSELRGFARKRTGAIGPVPLSEVVEGARLILKERLARVALSLPVIPPDLLVIAGRVRLEQVLVNLLQNATEALADSPAPRIDLTLTVEADTVRLHVADNGPGIAPEVADRIFTPFVTSRPSGLGLGLVISQDIMTDLDGALRLIPSASGATFEIALRRAA